jgi:hypothetical protein
VPSEGTVAIPHYKGETPLPIQNFQTNPMPGRAGLWQGRFELERAGEANALEAWRENRSRLGMRGLEGATIRWTDFRRGVAHEYSEAALRYDGQGFIFDGAQRKP